MTQEDKDLLLEELSARLPYGVAIDCRDEDSRFTCYLTTDILREIQNNTYYWEYKPYLLPLSSMTEEQKEELCSKLIELELKEIHHLEVVNFEVEYYLKNHLDYMLLIPRGLAIDATGLNIY